MSSKKMKNWKTAIDLIVTLVVVVFNAVFFIVGLLGDWFTILQENDGIYSINNSALAVIITSVFVEVLAIYHGVSRNLFSELLSNMDKGGTVNEGVRKVEAHLINYNRNTIEFSYLSAIESEVGISRRNIRNEVWVITNDFEEAAASDEGAQLRNAIANNLRTNVDYYYILPSYREKDMKLLCQKLRLLVDKKKQSSSATRSGSIKYILDDALDFIPTSYFDIVMYLNLTPVGSDSYAESNSQIYYCFSRNNDSDEYFYLKVEKEEEKEIWERMVAFASSYKVNHEFIDGLQ